MKRLSFLTALFGLGVAKAQSITFFKQNCEMDGEGLKCTPRGKGAYLRFDRNPLVGKPRNGECPVCGTMAEPFKPERMTVWRDNCAPQPPTSLVGCIGGGWVDGTPTSRRIDCAHCGNTFKQEAEK